MFVQLKFLEYQATKYPFFNEEFEFLKLQKVKEMTLKKTRLFYISIFMKFWSRNNLNKLDWLTPQDVYCCTRLLYKVLLVSIFLIAMHKIKGPSMVDYAIHGYFISLIKCIIINASSNVHLSSKLHTFGQFQQLSCNIIHKSWHKKITNVDDLLVLCHRKKKTSKQICN